MRKISSLGVAEIPSPLIPASKKWNFPFIEDQNKNFSKRENDYELAGPRKHNYFNSNLTKAAIVSCGGLCPGINNVIRTLVMQLSYNYQIAETIGFVNGYLGLTKEHLKYRKTLVPENVKHIHELGGSVLSSSRGLRDVEEMVDSLVACEVGILFCIGGDGTLKGAHALAVEIEKRGLKISIIGIPKTIDNDILHCSKTFGLETAFAQASLAISTAHTEACGFPFGISIVKVMGRDSGFIAANTTLACPEVNFVLIPETDLVLHGKDGLIAHIDERFKKKIALGQQAHALIVVAEGVGQDLLPSTGETDASGNQKYQDIGLFLKKEIQSSLGEKYPLNIKYIDPSYMIRSTKANAHDAVFCHGLADNAVHSAMAGKTNLMIGFNKGEFVHVHLADVIKGRKRVDTSGHFWRQVLASTRGYD